jgi:hypothetical protein
MQEEEQEEIVLRPIRCVKCKDIFFGEVGKEILCKRCKEKDREKREKTARITEQYLKKTGKDRL